LIKFLLYLGVLVFNTFVRGKPLNLGPQKLVPNVALSKCNKYILNRSGVTFECDGRKADRHYHNKCRA